jgi:plastocyanin
VAERISVPLNRIDRVIVSSSGRKNKGVEMKKIGSVLAAMALLGTLVTACGGSSSTTAAATGTSSESSATQGAAPTITIANMAFGQPLTVAPGTKLNVVNNDSVEHSVTSQSAGAFDVHVDGGKQKTLTAPSQPGEYPFYCVYHPSMKGTLTVT